MPELSVARTAGQVTVVEFSPCLRNVAYHWGRLIRTKGFLHLEMLMKCDALCDLSMTRNKPAKLKSKTPRNQLETFRPSPFLDFLFQLPLPLPFTSNSPLSSCNVAPMGKAGEHYISQAQFSPTLLSPRWFAPRTPPLAFNCPPFPPSNTIPMGKASDLCISLAHCNSRWTVRVKFCPTAITLCVFMS